MTFMVIAFSALALWRSAPARAHPFAPAHLVVTPLPDGAEVVLRQRPEAPLALFPPPHCVRAALADTLVGGEGARSPGLERETRERWTCRLAGPLVVAQGTAPVVVEVRGEAPLTTVLDPAHPVLVLGASGGDAGAAFVTWLVLGVEHLVGGPDHVMLVVGLVLLIGLRRRLVAALTAFTLGHSLSLGLGATGVLVLPSALVESAIAATLVLLALDLVRPPRGDDARARESLFVRAPWLTGLAVGLVHGLGFAGVLQDLGLPKHDGALALVAFNVGLELAQLGLVAALAALYSAARAARAVTLVRAARGVVLAGWVIGVVGAAWLIERSTGL